MHSINIDAIPATMTGKFLVRIVMQAEKLLARNVRVQLLLTVGNVMEMVLENVVHVTERV
jgi:hypothetical protein